jgi:hypothetical protein
MRLPRREKKNANSFSLCRLGERKGLAGYEPTVPYTVWKCSNGLTAMTFQITFLGGGNNVVITRIS